MNEQAFDKNNADANPKDNLSQQEIEDAIAAGLNVDENIAGSSNLDENFGDEEMEQIAKERDDYKDKYMRLVAEFDNFRKRNAKERMELILTAGKDVVQSLLEVLDDADRASKQLETATDMEQVKEGVSLVFNKLRNTMQQKGLKKMESQGETFDPELHEAITEIPAPDESMVGKIVDVIEPGYYLNDKLIRYAKVVVGK